MPKPITLEELTGSYDISYQTTPQLPDWIEPGYGAAKIEGNNLAGVDALGVIWSASFSLTADNTMIYKAVLDPSQAPANVGLLNNQGQMTREPQNYNGEMRITANGPDLILRTRVLQGPMTIDVQFIKRR